MSWAFYPVTTTNDELPAPKSWSWRELTSVARLESGHTPSRRQPTYWEGGEIPWLSLKDIKSLEGRYVHDTVDKPTQEGINHSSARVLPKGTVAFCRTASVGKVAILGQDMATSQDFANWVCGPEVLPEYLYEALRASGGQFDKEKQGSTHKTIYMPTLGSFRILLPPIAEQRRIADILDNADVIRRKRKEAIALTEDLLRSTFLEMFGDPVTNPKGWPVHKLGKIIQRFEAGTSVGGEPRQRDSGGLGVLKISAVTSGVFLPHEHKAVPPDLVPSSLVVPRRGDLLFSRANTRELVAATCLVETDDDHLFLPDKLWRVVTSDAVKNEYLRYLFGHPGFRGHLTKRATGTSGSMLNVSMEKVNGLDAPVPSKSQQEHFARLVWRTYDLRKQLTVAHAESEALFSSLVHHAFRGELTSPSSRPLSPTQEQLALFE